MGQPEVSAIMAAYNGEQFIQKAIDSVLANTFTDFELIIVNDASSDNTQKICEENCAKDSRIKLINLEKNGGGANARNVGIKAAEGKYFTFIDCDDTVEPIWLETLHKAIIENPDAFIVTDMHSVDENGNMKKISDVDLPEGKDYTYFDIYKTWLSGSGCNKIYNTEKTRKNNIYYIAGTYMIEDSIFNIKYFKLCDYIYYNPIITYNYFYVEGSEMNRYYKFLPEIRLELFNARRDLIHDNEMEEFCKIHLVELIRAIRNTHDKRNDMSLMQQLKYNQSIIKRDDFQFCLKNANEKDNWLYRILEKKNYYLYYLAKKIIR